MLSLSPVHMQLSSLFLSIIYMIISINFQVLYALLLRKYGLALFMHNFIFVWDRLPVEHYVESLLCTSLGFCPQIINSEICVRHLLLVFNNFLTNY